jgi:hypothetical protein
MVWDSMTRNVRFHWLAGLQGAGGRVSEATGLKVGNRGGVAKAGLESEGRRRE